MERVELTEAMFKDSANWREVLKQLGFHSSVMRLAIDFVAFSIGSVVSYGIKEIRVGNTHFTQNRG